MATFYSGYSTGYRLVLTVNETSTSISGNTSNISWTLQCEATSAYAQWNPGPGLVSVNINGSVVYNNGRPAFVFPGLNSTITLCSGTMTIGHNADGSKSIACSASYTATSSAYYLPGNMSLSGNMSLTTIARATTPTLSASSVEMGNSVTINTPRASSSFTHTLKYSFGSVSGTIATGVATSKAWTVPTSLANQIPNAVSGTVTITCETYNGSSLIGTKTVNLTVTVTSSYIPAISSVSVTEATSGIASQFGVFVQHKSTFKIVTAASGSYGSTVDIISVSVDGSTYSGSTVTTSEIQSSGTVKVNVTATDSRGRSVTTTKSVSVTAYSTPAITVATVQRADSTGTVSDEGTYARCTYAYSISNVNNKNTHTFKIQRKSGTSWVDMVTYTDYTKSGAYISTVTFSGEAEHEFRFLITDYFGSWEIQRTMDDVYSLIHFPASGHSMHIRNHPDGDGYFKNDLPCEFTNEVKLSGSNFSISLAIQKIIGKLLNPVGTVVTNTTGVNPGTYLGGTWEAFAPGRVLIGVGTGNDGSTSMSFTPNSTGGKYRHRHQYGLLYGEFYGLHSRELKLLSYDENGGASWKVATSAGYQAQDTFNNGNTAASVQNANQYVNYSNTELVSNITPYISVHFWKRIS